jgi:hypothetical protein
MEDEKTTELKNKISELKQRLNQLYAQYFSDTREGKVFDTEFSLYVKASEYARREKSEQLMLQYGIIKTGVIALIVSSALIIFFFGQHIFFSTFFLLGLGFFAWGLMYLMLAAEIRITRAHRFCSALGKYFQQYRWSTESSQGLHLPDIPLWDDYITEGDTPLQSKHYEEKALYIPFRIAISFIDLLALVLLLQPLISGDATMSRLDLMLCLILWLVTVPMHMILVQSLVREAEIIRQPDGIELTEGSQPAKKHRGPRSWIQIFRLFFLLDIIVPKTFNTNRKS